MKITRLKTNAEAAISQLAAAWRASVVVVAEIVLVGADFRIHLDLYEFRGLPRHRTAFQVG